ncbi:MAG: hypothetical protein AAB618_00320 [Patescibacteria group bacterium]
MTTPADFLQRLEDLEQRVSLLEGGLSSTTPAINKDDTENRDEQDMTLAIANRVNDCEESELLQQKVLDAKSMEAKVLMCLYISHKYFNNIWLTSGNIEHITSELGIKVKSSNASTKLKELRSYLESAKVRKNGLPTPYRLNRQGIKYFENMLYGR